MNFFPFYRQITELKASHFTKEEEHRKLMIEKKKDYEKEVDALHAKVKSMQREIGTLTKKLLSKNAANGIGNSGSLNVGANGGGSTGGGSNGGGSGSQDESAANSPASST